jgi:DUF1009 family protein
MAPETIGLIAGAGQFPLLFARAARARGIRVAAVAIKGETPPELEQEVPSITWVRLGKLGKLLKAFHGAGVRRAVMCGGVEKTRLFTDVRPDFKALAMMKKMRHLADDGILRTLAEVLAEEGIEILPSHVLLPELLAREGVYTKRGPTRDEERDAELGWSLAYRMGRLDIGQCLVVKERVVTAVEAVEGTDACIQRGAELARGRAVVIKRCKPGQDQRFDLPSVGAGTVEAMAASGASCLVIEAGLTLVFDREEMVRAADGAGICVMAWTGKEAVDES